MKTITMTLEGISPLLMHAYPMVAIEAIEKKSKEEQAELAAYRMPSQNHEPGELHVPALCLQRALISAANFSKGKGRGSLGKVAAACLSVAPECLGLGTTTYAIDSRPVVVPATKGRIIRHRPRLDQWKVQAELTFDERLLTKEQVRRIVDDCGSRVGLLDFRPEKRGPFGRFQVARWDGP